jgi:hypothetical protein
MATEHPVEVPYPEAPVLDLRIAVGAVRLRVAKGDGAGWVAGTYQDPSGRIPLRVEQESGRVKISQAPEPLDWLGVFSGAPLLELRLGTARPFSLTVEGGANDVDLELGGIPLTDLTVKHGAGKIEADFEEPNPAEMGTLQLGIGAGSVEVGHIANANPATVKVDGGAAKIELDFGGTLRRELQANVATGAAGVEIAIPASTAARLSAGAVLGKADLDPRLVREGDEHWTEAARAGGVPVLRLKATAAVGSLRIALT